MKPDKEHLLSLPEVGSVPSYHFSKRSYAVISFFLQPLKALAAYQRFRNHGTFMRLPQILFGLLPALQDSGFAWFSDRLETVVSNLSSQCSGQPFLQVMASVFRDQLVYYAIVVQTCVILKMTVSYLLGFTIRAIESYLTGNGDGFGGLLSCSGALAGLMLVSVIVEQHYFQNIYQVSMKMRFAITGLLFRKLHQTTRSRLAEVAEGQFFNLVSVDLTELDSGLTWFIAFSGSLVVGALGVIILYSHFQYHCFVGLAVLVLVILLQRYIVASSAGHKARKNTFQDERTKLTEEVIQNIRTLKLYSAEHIFRNMMVRKRDQQDDRARTIARYDALAQSVGGNFSVFLSLILTSASFIYAGGGELSPDKVFGSLWVLQLIKVWCISYYYRALKFWTNMKLVERRVQEILSLKDVVQVGYDSNLWKDKRFSDKDSKIQMIEEEDMSIKKTEEREIAMVRVINFTGYWNKEKQQQQQPVLTEINFEVVRDQSEGRLIGVVGSIGSGKTSFLLSILSEIPTSVGKVEVVGSIAYVEQEPYIFPGTVQSNITFGLEYDHLRYKWAVQVSQMEADLQRLEKGDQTEVGEKGARLSGGQKARLSFCRAIYSRAQIFLLDDILSAVDTRVGGLLFHEGVMELRKQGKIVIFVTHQLQWVMFCDRVVHFANGRITDEASGISAIQSLVNTLKVTTSSDQKQQLQESEDNSQQLAQKDRYLKYDSEEDSGAVQEQEDIIPPVIPMDVYKKYVQEGGGTSLIVLITLLYVCDASLNLAVNKCFGQFAQDSSKLPLVCVLSCLHLMTNFCKLSVLFTKTINIISNMHRKLSASITKATIRYFDTTPLGLILARFTSDLANIEGMVMLDCHWVLEGVIDNLYIIGIVSIQNSSVLLVSVTLLFCMFWVKSRFHNFMKYAIKSDDQSRGALFSFVQSQIQGQTLVRSYNQPIYFYTEFLKLQYNNMQSYFTFLRLNALLGFTFDFSLNLLISLSLFTILIFQVKDREADAANIGFSLLMLMSLGYMFSLKQ